MSAFHSTSLYLVCPWLTVITISSTKFQTVVDMCCWLNGTSNRIYHIYRIIIVLINTSTWWKWFVSNSHWYANMTVLESANFYKRERNDYLSKNTHFSVSLVRNPLKFCVNIKHRVPQKIYLHQYMLRFDSGS